MIHLSDYQQKAVDWLVSKSGCGLIHGAIGTGKTYIALGAVKALNPAKSLIVVPKSVIGQWDDAKGRFLPDSLAARIQIVNYNVFPKLSKPDFDCVILDECSYIANSQTKRSKFVRKFLRARFRIALSGTPAPNGRLHEYFSVIDWISPGAFGASNFWQFRALHCRVHPFFQQKIIGYHDPERLRETIARHTYRIGPEVISLPPLRTSIEFVELSLEERLIYECVKKESILQLRSERITIPNVLAKLVRLRQLASGVWAKEIGVGSTKERHLKNLLKRGGRTLCFCVFRETADRLARDCGGFSYTGSQTGRERESVLKEFKGDPLKHPLFSTEAGGIGLNIQEAERVISYDLPWNPARLFQQVGRSWRRGQEKEVEHIIILARGTVDEFMYDLIKKKDREEKLLVGELLATLKK